MFVGFSVAAGHDRFGEHIKLGSEPNDCNGAPCVFEGTGHSGEPHHLWRRYATRVCEAGVVPRAEARGLEFGPFLLDFRPKACVIPAQGNRPGFIAH